MVDSSEKNGLSLERFSYFLIIRMNYFGGFFTLVIWLSLTDYWCINAGFLKLWQASSISFTFYFYSIFISNGFTLSCDGREQVPVRFLQPARIKVRKLKETSWEFGTLDSFMARIQIAFNLLLFCIGVGKYYFLAFSGHKH